VKALSLPTQDPHFVDAKPTLALELNKADLLLLIGADLEIGWLPSLINGARNPKIQKGGDGYLDCSTFVELLDKPAGAVDRSMGDIHPVGNPHYLSDPRRLQIVADGITAKLSALDPGNADAFAKRNAAFKEGIESSRKKWEERFAKLKGSPILCYHKTWSYVAEWLGLDVVGFLEPKPGIPPNPSHVGKTLALGKSRSVKILLQEFYYPETTSKLVAGKIPAVLVKVPAGVDVAKGEKYVEYHDRVLEAIAKGLEEGSK
jgi:zinc/manganese transport system substrate-binding protein